MVREPSGFQNFKYEPRKEKRRKTSVEHNRLTVSETVKTDELVDEYVENMEYWIWARRYLIALENKGSKECYL